MGIERAVRAEQLGFCCGQLTPAVNDFAFSAYPRDLGRQGAHDVHTQLGRGVALARRHAGVHRAAQSRIEQGGKPAAVYCAHRVQVSHPGRALKHGVTVSRFHKGEVQGLRNGWVR